MANRNRSSLVVFFVLAFALPWLIWGTTIAQSRGLISFHIPQPLAFWIGLNLATYIAAALDGGWPSVRDVLGRLIRWRVHIVWYGVALVLTGLVSLVAVAIQIALGGVPQFGVLLSLSSLLPSLAFQIFLFLLTEETAWRGFALPRLQARYSALVASLILGVLWGLWHLPLFYIPGSFQSSLPFVGFFLSTVAMTIVTTWVFNHTRGSVLVAAILHAATDVTIAYTGVMSGDRRLFWLFVGAQWLFALVVVFTEGGAHLSRARDLNGTTYVPAGVQSSPESRALGPV